MEPMAPSLALRQSSPVSAAFFSSAFASCIEDSWSFSWAKTVLASNLGVFGIGSAVSWVLGLLPVERDLSLGAIDANLLYSPFPVA